jgi:DNA segregation ATPase FtsK/SpoIIIE, S-DNA-T family
VAKAQPATRGRGVGTQKKKAPPETLWTRHRRDVWTIVVAVVGLFVAFAEFAWLGPVGHGLSIALESVIGLVRWVLPFALIGGAAALLFAKLELDRLRLWLGLALGLLAATGLAHFIGAQPAIRAPSAKLGRAGGWLGVIVGGGLKDAIGVAGTIVVLIAVLVVAVLLLTGLTLRAIATDAGTRLHHWSDQRDEKRSQRPVAEPRSVRATAPVALLDYEPEDDAPDVIEADDVPSPNDDYVDATTFDADVAFAEPEFVVPESTEPAPRRRRRAEAPPHSDWQLPPSDLLQRVREHKLDRAAIDAAGDELVTALAAHGVETTLVGYTVGPTVTRFEIELGAGVKVAQVTSLHRDIAYAMASPDVRILAPIPGRSAIGVEVPNRQRALVTLGDLLAADETAAATHPLDVPLGRDIAGQAVIANLGAMPHILISGATGAGKSSCINSIITGLVMRATPDQVKLLLIDPKRVELGQYNDLPHLLLPVVVDPKKAAATLTWAVREMTRRYDVLAQHHVRDIQSYQNLLASGDLGAVHDDAGAVTDAIEAGSGVQLELVEPDGPEALPYIVIVVDELNDLMLVAARDVEDSVVRIAQMARAVGIHLVLATQRPSVDVITGVIKANIPSRMAFAVSSLADSRVILDQAGAERLIGKGDVLLLTSSSNVTRRLQSPWVSEEEVRSVVAFWRAQGKGTEPELTLIEGEGGGGEVTEFADEDDEVMLARARELVLRTQSGSTSMLQRKLRVGFARAGRLMDELELEGIVAPGEGSKSRRVLKTWEQYEASTPPRHP